MGEEVPVEEGAEADLAHNPEPYVSRKRASPRGSVAQARKSPQSTRSRVSGQLRRGKKPSKSTSTTQTTTASQQPVQRVGQKVVTKKKRKVVKSVKKTRVVNRKQRHYKLQTPPSLLSGAPPRKAAGLPIRYRSRSNVEPDVKNFQFYINSSRRMVAEEHDHVEGGYGGMQAHFQTASKWLASPNEAFPVLAW